MQTIVWDVDDVLNDLMRQWLERAWRVAHPECRATYEQLSSNPPHTLLGCSLAEYRNSLDAFRTQAQDSLAPVPEVVQWFERYGRGFHHVALTATVAAVAPLSAAWVMRHFGQWVRTFAYVPASRPEVDLVRYHTTKAEYLKWWGRADILIDDHPENIRAAADAGNHAILVQQPWSPGGVALPAILANLGRLAVQA